MAVDGIEARPMFDLHPQNPEPAGRTIGLLAQSGGTLVGAMIDGAVRTWLVGPNGQLILLILPSSFRARFDPFQLLDERGQVVAEGGDAVTVAGGYLVKAGDPRRLGHEHAFSAWQLRRAEPTNPWRAAPGRPHWLRKAARLLSLVIIATLCTTTATYRVPSGAMAPTLRVGEHVIVSLDPAYAPRVGDIVVFHPPAGAELAEPVCGNRGVGIEHAAGCPSRGCVKSSGTWIKRIVAGPGDTLAITDGRVILNGEQQEELYYVLRCDKVQPRGRTAARTEWRLQMATHYLTKRHRHHLATAGA